MEKTEKIREWCIEEAVRITDHICFTEQTRLDGIKPIIACAKEIEKYITDSK